MNWNAHSRWTSLVTLAIAIFVVVAQLPAAAQSASGNDAWEMLPGEYTFLVGGSSRSLPLKESIDLK